MDVYDVEVMHLERLNSEFLVLGQWKSRESMYALLSTK